MSRWALPRDIEPLAFVPLPDECPYQEPLTYQGTPVGPYVSLLAALDAPEPAIVTLCLTEHVSSIRTPDGVTITEIRE